MSDLFGQDGEAPRAAWPSWFKGGTRTKRDNVARGLHPLGMPLHEDETKSCGGCSHLFVRSRGRRWTKCDLRATGCRATDISRRWRACAMFKPRGEAPTRISD